MSRSSDKVFHKFKDSDLTSILTQPLVDTNNNLPTLNFLLSTHPGLEKVLEQSVEKKVLATSLKLCF